MTKSKQFPQSVNFMTCGAASPRKAVAMAHYPCGRSWGTKPRKLTSGDLDNTNTGIAQPTTTRPRTRRRTQERCAACGFSFMPGPAYNLQHTAMVSPPTRCGTIAEVGRATPDALCTLQCCVPAQPGGAVLPVAPPWTPPDWPPNGAAQRSLVGTVAGAGQPPLRPMLARVRGINRPSSAYESTCLPLVYL